MPDEQSTLSACLQKARELRITQGFGLFILTKLPDIHDYRLVNCSRIETFKLWLQTQTHKFVCLIDEIDIIRIDTSLPFDDLHSLFGQCEALKPKERTCIELTDFLELLIERANGKTSEIPN